jgi:hypothetical protein
MLKFLAASFLSLFFIHTAFSAIWIEPYLGINISGQYKLDSAGTTRDYDNYPLFLGGRLGGAVTIFQFGLDYMKSAGVELEGDTNKYKITELGAFVGVKLPLLVRGYIEYIISSEFSDTNATYDEGSGFKAGIGYTGLPLVIINVEVRQVAYDKYNGGGRDMDNKSTALTVSLPLSL